MGKNLSFNLTKCSSRYPNGRNLFFSCLLYTCSLPYLHLMATQTENPASITIAAPTSFEGNPSKILAKTVPASNKPDQIDDSAAAPPAVDSSVDKTTKEADDPKGTKGSAVSSLPGTSPAVTDTEKKIRRAERFGINVQLSEEEKRNSRAERFGTASVSPSTSHGSDTTKKAEELKRKARAERFGLPVPSVPADEEAKKKARRDRFAQALKKDAVEEDKRKARALRFSQPSTGSLSTNEEGNIEPKAAVASKAGEGS